MDRGIAKRHVRQHWTGNGRRPVMVSVHKDYADFALFYQKFRRDWGGSLQNFRTFLVSVRGSVLLKALSPNSLEEAYAKQEA